MHACLVGSTYPPLCSTWLDTGALVCRRVSIWSEGGWPFCSRLMQKTWRGARQGGPEKDACGTGRARRAPCVYRALGTDAYRRRCFNGQMLVDRSGWEAVDGMHWKVKIKHYQVEVSRQESGDGMKLDQISVNRSRWILGVGILDRK